MEVFDILRRPIITEKGLRVKEAEQTVVFEVAASATKTQIKDAVEKLFNAPPVAGTIPARLGPRRTRGNERVTVVAVRTANYHGKFRRRGRSEGYRSDWKKAYVKLAASSKMVEFGEG